MRSASPCPWKSPIHIIALTDHALQGERESVLRQGWMTTFCSARMAGGQTLGKCHAFMEGDRGERTKHSDQRRPQQ
jgi:hypothetical protein